MEKILKLPKKQVLKDGYEISNIHVKYIGLNALKEIQKIESTVIGILRDLAEQNQSMESKNTVKAETKQDTDDLLKALQVSEKYPLLFEVVLNSIVGNAIDNQGNIIAKHCLEEMDIECLDFIGSALLKSFFLSSVLKKLNKLKG